MKKIVKLIINFQILIIGFIFSGCSFLNEQYVEPYNHNKLNNEALIMVSLTKDNSLSYLNEIVILDIENINTKENHLFSNYVCHIKIHWFDSIFVKQKIDHISENKICGNVNIGKLGFGDYKIKSILIRTYNNQGRMLTNIKYTLNEKNTFSLKEEDELVYLGNIFIKTLMTSFGGSIYKLELSAFDNSKNDKVLIQNTNFIDKDYIFINNSLNIPSSIVKDN